ncbi:MAG TPA: protein arginine kinase [Planctomycetaceae bacterium]|nr:protein arginine kinase [Planctomycetaceae bacterium]
MDIDSLSKTAPEWLRGTGPEAEIVVSSRIRLARNLAQFPFLSRADDSTRTELEHLLRDKVTNLSMGPQLEYVDVRKLSELDRQFLVERQLISKELAEGEGARSVAFDRGQSVSVMINEEDHLRMQVIRSGFSLEECWTDIDRLDDAIEEEVTYAFSEELGYLTACPTNVGSGIRVSVMLHLPALHMSKEIQKVLGALQKISLAVRGLYGEGTQASGQFFQVSNQITLGKSESQIMEDLREVVPSIIAYEHRVRDEMLKDNRARLHDQISRAFGILQSAQTISSEETMDLLSSLRLGVSLGMIDDLDLLAVNELFIHTQPAHLQKVRGEHLGPVERNAARAAYLRQRLNHE